MREPEPKFSQLGEAALDRVLDRVLREHPDAEEHFRSDLATWRNFFAKLGWAVAKRIVDDPHSPEAVARESIAAIQKFVVKASPDQAEDFTNWFRSKDKFLMSLAQAIAVDLAATASSDSAQRDGRHEASPRSESMPMIIVAIYNNKGGIGKTTLAAHLCMRAAQLGIRTAGCAVDVQGDFMRWFVGRDAEVLPELVHEVNENLIVFYWPRRMPPNLRADLLVIDMPPALELVPEIRPHVLVAPIDQNAASVDNLMNVIEKLKENPEQRARIYLLLNKVNAGGIGASKEIRKLASRVPGTELWPHEIINSPTINRTGVLYQPVWADKHAPDGDGAKSILKFTDGFLEHLGFKLPAKKK